MVAACPRLAKVSQGPIIHPNDVGQPSTSLSWMSWWKYESARHLIGVVWVHTIAFGSLVVPEENRMFASSSGVRALAGYGLGGGRNSFQVLSPGRSEVAGFAFSGGNTMVVGAFAAFAFS